MPFAAFGKLRLFFAALFITLIATIDVSMIRGSILDLVLMGRVPGTNISIGFEAFFSGFVFVAWAAATYNFTLTAIVKIVDVIKIEMTQQEIDEVAL